MSASKELFETDVLCETLPMEVQVVVHHDMVLLSNRKLLLEYMIML